VPAPECHSTIQFSRRKYRGNSCIISIFPNPGGLSLTQTELSPTEQKISGKAAWDVPVIADLAFLPEEDVINFNEASLGIDYSTKVYAAKVNYVWLNTLQILGGAAPHEHEATQNTQTEANKVRAQQRAEEGHPHLAKGSSNRKPHFLSLTALPAHLAYF
jgi:hypothetical protein